MDEILGFETVQEWLRNLDAAEESRDTSQLIPWLKSEIHHVRLGYYFSLLLEFWFSHCPVFATDSATKNVCLTRREFGKEKAQPRFVTRCFGKLVKDPDRLDDGNDDPSDLEGASFFSNLDDIFASFR